MGGRRLFFLIILHIFARPDVIMGKDEIYQSCCETRVVKMGKSDELYERLISPIEKRMIGIVARIVRDPEDEEVLALIWAKFERIDRHPNPHAYIIRICITRSYDALRKRARRRREIRLESIQAKMWPARSLGYIKEEGDRVTAIREAIGAVTDHGGLPLSYDRRRFGMFRSYCAFPFLQRQGSAGKTPG
jgi:hypothetical protein